MMSSADNCIVCHKLVRPKQEALQCDNCGNWTHRTCKTGVSQQEYKVAVRTGQEIDWTCISCSAETLPPTNTVLPVAESTVIDDLNTSVEIPVQHHILRCSVSSLADEGDDFSFDDCDGILMDWSSNMKITSQEKELSQGVQENFQSQREKLERRRQRLSNKRERERKKTKTGSKRQRLLEPAENQLKDSTHTTALSSQLQHPPDCIPNGSVTSLSTSSTSSTKAPRSRSSVLNKVKRTESIDEKLNIALRNQEVLISLLSQLLGEVRQQPQVARQMLIVQREK